MEGTNEGATVERGAGEQRLPWEGETNYITLPAPDAIEIARALSVLFEPNAIVELRALFTRGRKYVTSGYYDGDHRDDLIREAARLNKDGAAVYVTLNVIDPQLLGRYANRIEDRAAVTTSDANVIRRRWLLIDLDPVRPKDTSATEVQLAASKALGRECFKMLRGEGWPDPVVAWSGNGVHLLYPIDLPNDPETTAIVKGALQGLAQRFNTDGVKLDQSGFNAGRIVKPYGTVANKGDHTPGTPWRVSRIVRAPKREAVVTLDQLRGLAPPAPAHATARDRYAGAFDLDAFLGRLGIGYTQDAYAGGERYKLTHCPFNAEHGFGEAAVFRAADGTLGFDCKHNSCADRRWGDLREMVDGPQSSRREDVRRSHRDSTDNATVGVSGGEEWPEPMPLLAGTKAEPYPLDALPKTIRASVEEVQSFTKAPVPLVASSALGAVSGPVQAHVDVKRAEKLQGPSSLSLLTIADSGERKTTCDSYYTSAIREYEKAEAEKAGPILKDHAASLGKWTAERDGILLAIKQAKKNGKATCLLGEDLKQLEHDKPKAPRVPKLLRMDETPEHLAWLLAKEWPSAVVASNEAGIVFGSHGMGKDNVMRNLALLNILWDGGPLSIGRRTSESFTVRVARLTLSLQVQEATLLSFFDRSEGLARGTGFLSRFLVSWPESTQGFRPFTEPPATWPALAAFDRRITEILDQPVSIDDDGALSPIVLTLTPAAKAEWVAFHDAIEGELASGGELYDVRDVASKTADNAVRLAALFQVFEHGMGGTVGLEAIEGASRIAAWHLNEFRRFFGELALPVELGNAVRLDAWLIEYCRRERVTAVPKNHVRQHGPGSLRSKSDLDPALTELAESARVRLAKDGKRVMVQVNPALLGGTS